VLGIVPVVELVGRDIREIHCRDKDALRHGRSSYGLVGIVETALGKEILDVSEAEREAQVEPDGMLDDDRRKSVTG
jgi:hypothetical protein